MNLFDLPPQSPDELTGELLRTPGLRLERIVSWGQASPKGFWYDQEEDEWLCLLQGTALLSFLQYDVFLTRGDVLLLPAHLRHRVEATSIDPPAVWLCAFGKFDASGGTP